MENNHIINNISYHIQNYREYKIYNPKLANDVRYLICTTELLNITYTGHPDIVSEIFVDFLDQLPNITNTALISIKEKVSSVSRAKSYEYIAIGLKKVLNHHPLNEKEKNKIEELSEEINDLISVCNNELQFLKNISNANNSNEKPTLKEIALYCHYTNLHISHQNSNEIAIKFGYNSGARLYQNFLKCTSRTDRLAIGETAAKQKNKIIIFEKVIAMLKNNNLDCSKAEQEKALLEEKYSSF